MEEKEFTVEQLQELYNKGKYGECVNIAPKIINAENIKTVMMIDVKSGLCVSAQNCGEGSDSFFESTLQMLKMPFDWVKSKEEIISFSSELFKTYSDAYEEEMRRIDLNSMFSLNGVDGEKDEERLKEKQNLQSVYIDRSKKIIDKTESIIRSSESLTTIILKENFMVNKVCEKISENLYEIRREALSNAMANAIIIAGMRCDSIAESVEKQQSMSFEEVVSHSKAFITCLVQIITAIEGENTAGARFAYIKGQDEEESLKFVFGNKTSTVSREYYVKIASKMLNAKTLVDGIEVPILSSDELRQKFSDEMKNYIREIKAINSDYEVPDSGSTNNNIRSTSSVNYGTQQTEPVEKKNDTKSNPGEKPNTRALVGFIISIFSLLYNLFGIIGAVGAIVSGASLKKIKKSGEKGKVLAYVGIVIGIYSVIYGIIQTINLL